MSKVRQIPQAAAGAAGFISVAKSHKCALAAFYMAIIWLLTAAVYFGSTPIYEATAIISLQPGRTTSGEVDKFATPLSTEQLARSQITLLESEDVLRRAIDAVGVSRLANEPPILGNTRRTATLAPRDAAFLALRKSISARYEPNTSLIKLTYRHRSPEVAEMFTNAWTKAFSDRYFEIYSDSQGVTFFRQQRDQSAQTFKRVSAELAAFSSSNQLFSVDEQRRLLLQQRSSLMTALIQTRGSIAQYQRQVAAIPGLLARMKPVNRLPQLTGLTAVKPESEKVIEQANGLMARLANDPPLLLVRVYQDTIASLVKLNIDIEGLQAFENSQMESLTDLDREIMQLSAKQGEFERLQVEFKLAKASAELFGKRTLEEQLAQDLNAKMLSSVRVAQPATLPLLPVWPNPVVLLLMGLGLSAAPALAMGARYLSTSMRSDDTRVNVFRKLNLEPGGTDGQLRRWRRLAVRCAQDGHQVRTS